MDPRISIITLCSDDMPRSYNFYKEGLGFYTPQKKDSPIYFFETRGTRIAIYPREAMAKEFPEGYNIQRSASQASPSHIIHAHVMMLTLSCKKPLMREPK